MDAKARGQAYISMVKHKGIPLIQASVVEPFITAAKAIGSPVERRLLAAGLPLAMLDNKDMLVPEKPAWKFVQMISDAEEAPLFGAEASYSAAYQDIRTIKPLLEGCVNLGALLLRFCAIAPLQSSVAIYVLKEQGDIVWFVDKGARLTSSRVQVELFKIAGMIQLVQLVMGKQWRPDTIHFSVNYQLHLQHYAEFNPSSLLFSQSFPAIAIPRKLLILAVPDKENDQGESSSLISPLGSINNQLSHALFPYIGAEKINESLLSDITGMSFRSLQRNLKQHNTSYSKVLNQIRFKKAEYLLKNTDEKLLEISFMLGYENASAFSRAFKRWSGVSPREFRSVCRPEYVLT